jgi:transitional endoplasmic reticulum ATPase
MLLRDAPAHSCKSNVLVCTTNFVDQLDQASLRRFHFKIEFLPMRENDRAGFFLNYFSDYLSEIPFVSELASALRTIPFLTPGDFRAVRQRIRYQEQKQSWRQLIAELIQESKYKKRTNAGAIGFQRLN